METIPAAGEGVDHLHLRFRDDSGSSLFREVEVVLVERVLRADLAPGHARTALGAARSPWSLAVEVRVGDLLAWLTEEHPHPGGVVVLGAPQVRSDLGREFERQIERSGFLGIRKRQTLVMSTQGSESASAVALASCSSGTNSSTTSCTAERGTTP